MLKGVVFLLSLVALLSAKEIRVAAAANVSYPMEELKSLYESTHKDSKVTVTLGSSGKLVAQILNKAPFDIFLSADMKYPNELYDKNLSIQQPIVYAKGSLILFTIKDDVNLSKGISVVKDVEKIAVASYKTAPYGLAAVESLKNSNLYDGIESKFVNAESITQALQFVMTAADVGFIAKSSVFSDKLAQYNKEGKYWINIDPKLYSPIDQGVALLNDDALEFYNFLFSKEAKAIFKKYGYIVD